jgi:hypothetical protein
MALIDELLKPRVNPFPTNAAGALVNPDYVQKEGQRIRDSLAAGSFGTGANLRTEPGPITVVSPSSPGDGQAPTIWEQSAWNQNPSQQREALSLDILRSTASQRKFDLERDQARAPVLNAYDQAKLDHEMAATGAIGGALAFRQAQDAQSMQHVTGFAQHMQNAPPVNSPAYAPYVLQGVMKYPRMATTAWGKETLGKLAQEHDTISDLMGKVPGGFDLSSVTVGANGKPSVTMKPTDADEELAKSAKGYGLTLDQIRNPVGAEVGKRGPKGFEGDEKGDIVRVENGEGKKVTMSVKEYQRLGGTFSQEGAARRSDAPAIDLSALARKALDDPNAPADVKAAARKRLGK